MVAIVLGNLLLFGRTLAHFFVAIDFADMEWATGGSALRLFDLALGLYRPTQYLLFRWLFNLFGVWPVPFNVLNLLIHTGNSLLVMWLASRLTKSVAKGFLCGAIFSVHFMHVEPVIWVASLNHLLATGFLLGVFVLFDCEGIGRRVWSLILFVLAILSKETAIVIPLLLLIWLWANSKLNKSSAKGTILYFCISAAYIAIRLPILSYVKGTGSYAMRLGVNVVKNIVFIISAMFFRLNYRELLEAWNVRGKGLVAAAEGLISHPLAVILVITSLACFSIMFWRGGRAVKFGAAWVLCSMLTVIFLVGTGERFTYLPSVGFAIMSGVIVLRLKRTPAILAGSAICIYLFAVGFLDSNRWILASGISKRVTTQLAGYIIDNPSANKIYINGLPDNYKGAYMFRGGLGPAARLISGKRSLEVIDTDEEPGAVAEPGVIYLRYVEGRLEEFRRPLDGP